MSNRTANRFTADERTAVRDALNTYYDRYRDDEDGDPVTRSDERRHEGWARAIRAIHCTYYDLRQSERDELWSMVLAADEKWIER